MKKNQDAVVLDSPQTMSADSGDFRVLFRDGTELDCSGMSKRNFARLLVKLCTYLQADCAARNAP